MSGPNWSRRRALSAAGVGVASLAGCISGDSDDGDDGDDGTTVTPETTPEPDFTPPTPDPGFEPDPDWEPPTDVPTSSVEVNVLVENLEIPWDIALAANGDLFVTERTGQINRFSAGDIDEVLAPGDAIDAEAVAPGDHERPWWVHGGEGGTMGIETHPDYPDEPWVYVCYTTAEETNKLVRYDISADDPGDTEEVLVEFPGHQVHNGGRIEFGPDGYLWVGTGSAAFDEEEESSQVRDLSSLAGKVLRVDADGEPAPDNPEFGGDADPRIYSFGHRNVQGIVWPTPETPIVTEHGPTARDEINRLVAGGDYGWDYYDDAVRSIPEDDEHETYVDHDGVFPPLVNTGPGTTWAPSGATFYTGNDVPSWQNRMIVGGLISQTSYVLTLTPPGADLPPEDGGTRYDADWYDHVYTVTAHPVLEDQLGRVRHLTQGNDGELYAITSNRDGRADSPFPTEQDDVLVRIESS